MSMRLLLGWLPCVFLLAGCAPSLLRPLAVEGPELHSSLVTRKVEDAATLNLATVLKENPCVSTEPEFVDVLARISSQGRLRGGEGVREALYGLYIGENEVGLYGLEAMTDADADRIEGVLREIWAHNARLGLARVHRRGRVLVVAWNNGVSSACWEAVNAGVMERLGGPRHPCAVHIDGRDWERGLESRNGR